MEFSGCFLEGLNFHIRQGERVGIVGRTGAGKSSILSALFRMPESDGEILIDDTPIKNVNIRDSRRALAAIPQSPFLFTGSLRFNLDPENKHADEALWDALDHVSLKQLVQNLSNQLDSHVTQGGRNFSVGERQLFCVARALLQDKKIVVLDEATANVDMKTDRLLQEVIRSKLKGCTVLAIAHRLETVLDYDKVLVMDSGKVVEFGSPRILLERRDSVFSGLYNSSVEAKQSVGDA